MLTRMATLLNGSLLKVAICVLLLNTSSSVVLEFAEITDPMSWDDAFLSGRCRIQSDVIADVDSNSVHFNHTIDGVTEAWVGVFATSLETLTFEGCRVYTEENILAGSTGHVIFDNQTDILKSCQGFCKSSRFGLSNDTCFCLEDDISLFYPLVLPGVMCPSDYEALCGSGPTLAKDVFILLLCIYRPVNVSVSLTGPGDCATYNTASRQTKMVDCAFKKNYVCDRVTKNDDTVVPSSSKSGWWEAANKCVEQHFFFGNETSLTRHVGSSGTAVDSYWTNVFRRTSYSFASPGDVELGRCVAVRNNSGIFTLFVEVCNASLPALCRSVTTDVPTTTIDVTSLINTDVTMPTRDVTVAQTIAPEETKLTLWPLAFVALGIVIIVVVSIVLWRRNRASTRKMKTSRLVKHMSHGARAAKPENNRGFNIGNTYETSFIESEPNRVTTKTKSETLSVSSHNDTTDNKQVITTAEIAPDDIYNELNEKKTDTETDDIYDHTRDINSGNDTYDGFRRSDSLGNNGTDDCTEYDTMANIQSTGNGSIYDTCSNEHVTKPEVTDFNDYDSMININAAN